MKQIARRYPHLLMTAILLVVSVVAMFRGERMIDYNGLGWDGRFYVALAQGFETSVFVEKMDRYHTQRIVPSGIVHYSLRALGLPLSDQNVLWGFRILDLLLLLTCCWLWKRIADELALSLQGRWIGFMGLFVSFAVMKMTFYYPNMTDTAAFTLGLAILYFYLRRRMWGIVAVSLIGAFTWPTFLYGGIIMILFPRPASDEQRVDAADHGIWSRIRVRLNLLVADVSALAVAGFIIVFHFIKERQNFGWETAPIVEELYYLSVLLLIGYVFALLYVLLEDLTVSGVLAAVRSIRRNHIIVAVATFLVAWGGHRLITDFDKKAYTALLIVKSTILVSITRPLLFIVPHVIYFGPIILLAIILWRPVTRLIRNNGMGLLLFVLLNIPMALNAESRRSVVLLPVVVAFTAMAAESLRWKRWNFWVIGGLALIFTKVWYPINQGSHEGNTLTFPAQHLFMNAGPWIADGPYLAQGIVVLLAGLLLRVIVRQAQTAQSEEFNNMTTIYTRREPVV